MKKSHLPSLWSQRLVENLFLLWDFRFVSSCFCLTSIPCRVLLEIYVDPETLFLENCET